MGWSRRSQSQIKDKGERGLEGKKKERGMPREKKNHQKVFAGTVIEPKFYCGMQIYDEENEKGPPLGPVREKTSARYPKTVTGDAGSPRI